MELGEKLQALRKGRGLTQEELAQALFVSRTAVSKWESGRGYPSIDSLKSIAKLFSVTIDELLSGDELLTIAEEDGRQKEKGIRDIVWGLLDFSVAVLFFLPFFAHRENGIIEEVSLLNLNTIVPHLKIVYLVLVLGIILSGVLTLALQNSSWSFWKRNNSKISLILNAICTMLFIISSQPYAATILFLFLIIKILMLIKTLTRKVSAM